MAEQTRSEAAWANVVETGPNIPEDLASAAAPAADLVVPVTEGGVLEPSPDDAPEEDLPSESEPLPAEEGEAAVAEVEEEATERPTGHERLNRRFSDLTRERDLAREREKFAAEQAAFWKQQAEAGQQRVQAETPPPVPGDGVVRDPQTGEPQFPVEEQYATTADYHAAMQRFRQADRQWVVQQAEQQILQRLEDRTGEQRIREQHPDYEQRLQTSQVRLNDHVSMAVMASPQKHELFYYFATHPEEAPHYANLTGVQAFLAIGELQARLRQGPTPEAVPPVPPADPVPALPTTSQAPPPIRPARGSAPRAVVSDDDLPLNDYFAKRNKEERAVQWR